ncbi:hypothetical protein K504DRAFT_372705 [Pleomassaria siparia CBS 279.74]|uniref:Uncharacterized protein n=1 Tax=Pleomassaria siparia CBS 279.74 TaxID=1314801 RepID=A0A6G1KIL2_9PLEO|nr:hypothetical protein K504DRAFT_372705 [Pleomassaria siparia CBS 279.74]
MVASTVVPQPDADWDEAQCKAALARLEELQDQLANLRLNLPRVVDPFVSQGPKSAVFCAFQKAVTGSQRDIKAFRTQWHSQDFQCILQHTAQSLNKNPNLSASAKVPRYGWVNALAKENEAAQRRSNGVQKLEDKFVQLTKEDIARDIAEFHQAYPSIKVLAKDDHQDLTFQFVAGSRELRIHVVIECETNGRHKLNAQCSGTVEPFLSITRCIASRPQANDLKYLLNMIAAYKTIKASSCAKCSKLIDNAALTPTARRSKQVAGANETQETIWEAFHEGCLD